MTIRKPDMLPPAEIQNAVRAIVQLHLGAGRDEVVLEASRLFGFKSTSAQIREVFEKEIDNLIASHQIELRNGNLYKAYRGDLLV